MTMISINVNMDSVEIEGQSVKRPRHIARSAWMWFWDAVKRNFEQ